MKRFQTLLIFSTALICLFFTANAQAATLIVSKTADTNDGACDADCSLREAIAAAAAAGDTITFSSLFDSPQTITLDGSLGQIVIGKNVTIQGPGANLLTVSAGGASRVFISGFSSGKTVTISGMTITGGALVNDDGAGIKNNGGITLNLTDVIVTGNSATSTSAFTLVHGGGIFNALGGLLNITNSIISNNTVSGTGGGSGGGIFNQSGSLNNVVGTITINGSIISGNSASNEGGGIYSNNKLTITNSTISNNQNTSPNGTNGGGIHIQTGGTATDQTVITGTTISGNISNNAGGGISIVQGIVSITNSTISGNTAVFGGAGIDSNIGATTLTNVTVSNNTATNAASSGAGVRTANGTFTTRYSIIAANVANNNPDVRGTFTSGGYNLVGVVGANASGFVATDLTGTTASPRDAKLAPLGNYGGATMTHALLKNSNSAHNSPAIDAVAPAATPTPPATDQRGVSRPQDGDNNGSSRADIGAFEVPGAQSNSVAALPSTTANQSGYNVTIAPNNVQNGVSYTYCISAGSLPPGLSGINACQNPFNESFLEFAPQSAVVISGTPTQSGTFNFTVRAFDSNGNLTETNYSLTVNAAPPACTAPPYGMIGWYSGDGNANDISSVQNNAALINGATYAPGMVQQAFSFDGVDDYVQAPSVPEQDPQTAATLDAWVLFNQTPSAAGRHFEIISKASFGSDFDLGALTDNRFYLYISAGFNVGSTTIIQPNVWYHVAGTWDATGLRMYVNGVLENTNSTQNVIRSTQPNRPLTIGNGTEFDRNNRWFSGLIDEAEVFNRALSASEVQAIYDAGTAGKCKNVTSYQISGTVFYAISPKAVPGVQFAATGASSPSATTDSSGNYTLLNLTMGGQYTVTPSKTTNVNGITPFDAVLILRCLAAGAGCSLTPNQRLAADTNASNSLTPFDATLILRYAAANGQTPNTGQVGNWKFNPATKTYPALNNSAFVQNYDAILIGEVNGSWTAP